MGSTNKTDSVFELSQFVSGVDRPGWLPDYNADMQKIANKAMAKSVYDPDGIVGATGIPAYLAQQIANKADKGPVQIASLWNGSAAAGTNLAITNMADYEMFIVRVSYEASALVGARISAYCRAFNTHGNTSGSSLTILSASLSNISATGCTIEYVTRYVIAAASGAITADASGAVTQIYGVRNYAG